MTSSYICKHLQENKVTATSCLRHYKVAYATYLQKKVLL